VPDLSRSPDRIAGMFDAIADRYDFLNHLLSAGIDRRWRRRAIQSLSLTGRERVVDVCTGTGDLAIEARRSMPPAARVIGVDFAHGMLRVAREKIGRLGLTESVAIVRGDAMRIPLASRSADAVTIAFGIRNVDDREAACREMHRVLDSGGRLAILEFGTPPWPVLRQLYLWYFHHVLPRIGARFSRHSAAYAYLPASVEAFASPAAFAETLRAAGFDDVRAVPLTFGIVFLYTAHRHQP